MTRVIVSLPPGFLSPMMNDCTWHTLLLYFCFADVIRCSVLETVPRTPSTQTPKTPFSTPNVSLVARWTTLTSSATSSIGLSTSRRKVENPSFRLTTRARSAILCVQCLVLFEMVCIQVLADSRGNLRHGFGQDEGNC